MHGLVAPSVNDLSFSNLGMAIPGK